MYKKISGKSTSNLSQKLLLGVKTHPNFARATLSIRTPFKAQSRASISMSWNELDELEQACKLAKRHIGRVRRAEKRKREDWKSKQHAG